MIDIIIPVYNARKTLFYTLCSIALQSIKNKTIIHIIDDCSIQEYDDIIDKFKDELTIKMYKLDKNSGPGIARQYGLENTNNEYICFIDSDDLFYNYYSLEKLYNEINKGADYVLGKVFNERNNLSYYTESDLHGKIYRRSFIMEKEIFFPDSRVHEDNVFNNLVRVNNPNTSIIPEDIYVYCNNQESITSVADDIEFERLEILIKNTDLVINQAFKNNCLEIPIKQFIFEKTKYLSKRYKLLDNIKKQKLKEMIDNSLLDTKYLYTEDYTKMKKDIMKENINKYKKNKKS